MCSFTLLFFPTFIRLLNRDAVNEEERRKKALEFVASEKALMVEQARAAKASSESALETIRVKRGRLQQLAATVI